MDTGEFGFLEESRNGFLIRYFPIDIPEDFLYWHQDKKDRLVFVMHGEGWKIQFEDELPIYFSKGMVYPIPKDKFHRLIKGSSELIIKIKEF